MFGNEEVRKILSNKGLVKELTEKLENNFESHEYYKILDFLGSYFSQSQSPEDLEI